MYKFLKRLFDLLASFLILIFLFPALSIITLINTLSTRANPFFLQTRYGKDLKPFKIIKFKTMVPSSKNKNILGKWSHGEVEITPFGKLLRILSIDELPNLLNVLKGDMSLIGPRPLLNNHIENYRKNHIMRHEVKPGITGLAQVKGRDGLSWNSKYTYDIFYVKKASIQLDLYILLFTIKILLNRTGYKEDGVDPPK